MATEVDQRQLAERLLVTTNSSFDRQIVNTRQRRLTGTDEIVLPLIAEVLTAGELLRFTDMYGATACNSRPTRGR